MSSPAGKSPVVVIIGAGPAGLTAAYELIDRFQIHPIILEATGHIGGIARTAVYKGNRIDLGGHRYFSKSDRVMSWWTNLLPLQGHPARDDRIDDWIAPPISGSWRRPIGSQQAQWHAAANPESDEAVMLVRQRSSKILFRQRFIDYPIALSWGTLANLGLWPVTKMVTSYAAARAWPIREERSLADFLTNRFGAELYRTFFKDYTEKVWGVPCSELKPDWGMQRIKGLSMKKVLAHAAGRVMRPGANGKRVETSLIGRFYYPKLGSGQVWEEAAKAIESQGGRIQLHQTVTGIQVLGSRVSSVESTDARTGETRRWPCDQLFSSMPVKDLIASMSPAPPERVRKVAGKLQYRGLITVGLLTKRFGLGRLGRDQTLNKPITDQWIYIQEPGVQAGRIQIYNNWSPYMVADRGTTWIGVEYFCDEGDVSWNTSDAGLMARAVTEMERIGVLSEGDVLDGVVIRVPKAYPAYHGAFEHFSTIRDWTDSVSNLFLMGRNGMHRYNNMDHSMLAAFAAVECACSNHGRKDLIWAVNTEPDYHEGD